MYRVTITYEVPEDYKIMDIIQIESIKNKVEQLYGINLNRHQIVCLAPLMGIYHDFIILGLVKRNGFANIINEESGGNRSIISFEGFDDVPIEGLENNLRETGDNDNDND